MKYFFAFLMILSVTTLSAQRTTQIIPAIFLVTDTTDYPKGTNLTYEQSVKLMGFSFQLKGFIEQELHSTAEGVMDPGFSRCADEHGNEISCYTNYWVTITNLGVDKKPIPKNIVIWQTR